MSLVLAEIIGRLIWTTADNWLSFSGAMLAVGVGMVGAGRAVTLIATLWEETFGVSS